MTMFHVLALGPCVLALVGMVAAVLWGHAMSRALESGTVEEPASDGAWALALDAELESAPTMVHHVRIPVRYAPVKLYVPAIAPKGVYVWAGQLAIVT